MEHIEAMLEGEWSSLSGMYTAEEADFMAQLLGNCSTLNELDGSSSLGIVPSNFLNTTGVDEGLYHSFDAINSNWSAFSQGSNYSGGSSISSHESYYFLSDSQQFLATNDSYISMDFCIGDEKNRSLSAQGSTDGLIEGDNECLNKQEASDGNVKESNSAVLTAKNLQFIEESEIMPGLEPASEDRNNNPSENTKKRSRSSGDSKRNVRSKKNQKLVSIKDDNEEINGRLNGQSSSSCCSEDDSNASQELNGEESPKGPAALNLNGKTRANKGSATDPQSLYARKRRERINERLRILQNLVPNGTKVDISTMLEEAVQYVKFLQIQIKLLSSDDLWMYAPIAYNGMDIGLDLKVGKLR
nr:basic helix-loop-helix transcription factor [Loropetalum chinense var. rubrum]